MVKIRYVLIGLLVVILALLGGLSLFQSDSKRIKKQFESLSKLVSKEKGESPLTMATKAKSVGALFAETCTLTVPVDGLAASYTPEEISGYAANTRVAFSELSLKFYDFNIEFPGKGIAKVLLTANLRGKFMNGDVVDETREVQSTLKKIDRSWLFSQIEVIEVLKK